MLLPDVAPQRVIALGDGPTATMARRIWPDTGAQPDRLHVDLIVADSPDDATLTDVYDLLGPDGTAYIEFDWPRWRRFTGLTDRLRRAGLPVRVLYSISPGRHRWSATWWIPVGSPSAIRFVAHQIVPAESGSARLVDRLRRRLLGHWQRRPHLAVNRPWLLHPSRRQRLGVVITSADRQPAGAGATATIMKLGGSSTDQPILFTFPQDAGRSPGSSNRSFAEPTAVVKVPTIDEEILSSRRESDILTKLEALDPPISSIPAPIDAGRYRAAGLHAFGQTYAPGRPMATVAKPEAMTDHATLVGDWLVELAERTAQPVGPEQLTSALQSRMADLDGTLNVVPDGDELRRGLADAVRSVDLPASVLRHNDLGPWNVHITAAGAITVIDWADASTGGLPACDFIHFLLHLALCAHDAYQRDGRDRLLAEFHDENTALGRLIERLTADHVARLGLPAAQQTSALRTLTWALDLLRRPEEQRTAGLYLDLLRASIRRSASRSGH